jgi:hypothetical protein
MQIEINRNANAKRSIFPSFLNWGPFERPTSFVPASARRRTLAWEGMMVTAIGGRVLSATKIGEANYGQKPICRFRC